MTIDAHCDWCKLQEEPLCHAFGLCPIVHHIWQQALEVLDTHVRREPTKINLQKKQQPCSWQPPPLVMLAEIAAIHLGIDLALRWSCLDVWVGADCQSVVKALKNGERYCRRKVGPHTYKPADFCRESDEIIRSTEASKSAGLIIISIAVSFRALCLEEPRKVTWRTSFRLIISTSTTVLVLIKLGASTKTPNDVVSRFELELTRAGSVDKSCPPFPSTVSSTRVVGGAPPAPLHSTLPDPHSPLAHVNLPELVEQRSRPQKRPVQRPAGMSTERLAPGANSKPVVESWGFWSPVRVAGQMGLWQLFFMSHLPL
ncbi:hypothetical protein F8388_002841 [Cannabis sativa]|uniref:RNase H type-1 domain-containing protein n=1 Tax=Cannabis sativa TaxID=3483 RepID=A0A7J6FJX9_CANSA|nr:hypothetical protein F8388_002841 [Cannabis sativa]